MQLEDLPSEILLKIFLEACTDGGRAGRSLSLVSKHIRAATMPAKYHSIAIHGVWQAFQFAQILDTISVDTQPVHHLFITDAYPYDKPTRHIDETGVPRRRHGLFGGRWSNDDRSMQRGYIPDSGVDIDPHLLTRRPRSLLANVKEQLSRVEIEKRRQKIILAGIERFPSYLSDSISWIPPKSAAALMYACTSNILTTLAPHLINLSLSLRHEAIFPNYPSTPVFPRLIHMDIDDFVLDHGAEGQGSAYPSLKSLSLSNTLDYSATIAFFSLASDEEFIYMISPPPTVTHVAYNIPSGSLSKTWAQSVASPIFSNFGIGEPLSERLHRPHLPKYISPTVERITLRILNSGKEDHFDEVWGMMKELTERDERVHLVERRTSREHGWLELVNEGFRIC